MYSNEHVFQCYDKVNGSNKHSFLSVLLQCIFLFALTWSIGASSDNDGRIKMDKVVRELMEVHLTPLPSTQENSNYIS